MGRLSSLRFGHALLEFVHPARGIHEFLLARIKRMANVANADQNGRLGGAGLNHVAAGAPDFRILIFRMDVSFHTKVVQNSSPNRFGKFLLWGLNHAMKLPTCGKSRWFVRDVQN